MAVTISAFKALTFGYLTGADLLQFAPFQLLASQYDIDSNSIQTACDFAKSEVLSQLSTRYDMATEFAKTGTNRSLMVVKLTALQAIRNALGNMQNISEKMTNDFTWLDSTFRAIRNGQMNVPLNSADSTIASVAELIPSSFQTLG